MADDIIPAANIECYVLLYRIETGLREFIIDVLCRHYGSRWHKTLPEDVKKKMLDGKESEKKAAWVNSIPFHPMYYTDFTALVKIIEQGDKWRDVFSKYFKRIDIIAATLRELEPIRNKIAHNRKASNDDLTTVKLAMSKLENWLTLEYLETAISKGTKVYSIKELLTNIKSQLEVIQTDIKNYEPVDNTDWWICYKSEWWFDSDYLGVTVEPIELYMNKVEEYSKLTRERGDGHIIERWVSINSMLDTYNNAINSVNRIMEAH